MLTTFETVRFTRALAATLTVALTAACAQTARTPATTPATPAAAAPAAPATGATAAPAAPAGAAAPARPAAAGGPGAGAAAASAKPAAPAMRTATSADGTKIAFEVTGSGPSLMLLHGGGQTRASWRERGYVDALAKSYTVISVDQRGFGNSGRPATPDAYTLDKVLADYAAVADAAGAKQFAVLGFGHGAAIARYLAARSDRVTAAVLVGVPMGPAVEEAIAKAMLGMRARWMPLIEAQQAGTLDLSGLSPGDRSAWDNGIGVTALALSALAGYPALEPAEIKVPTLWLVGAADESGMANVKQFESKLAGTKVTFKPLPGLSYSDSFGKSEPMLAEVTPFLKANQK